MAGAKNITKLKRPMAVPRCLGGKLEIIMFINSGMSIAEPEAWIMRPTISTPNIGEKPETVVPIKKRNMAAKNSARALNFCIK